MRKRFEKGDRVRAVPPSSYVDREGEFVEYQKEFARVLFDGEKKISITLSKFLELVKPERPPILMSEEAIFEGKSSDYETTPESVAIMDIRRRWGSKVGIAMSVVDPRNAMLDMAAQEVLKLYHEIGELKDEIINLKREKLTELDLAQKAGDYHL